MKTKLFIFILLSISCSADAAFAQCPVIPLPASCSKGTGQLDIYHLKHIVVADPALGSVARFLQKEVLRHTGQTISLSPAIEKEAGVVITISLDDKIPDGGYHLNIFPDKVAISASAPHGAFNGVISLLQLIRLSTDHTIACWRIEDAPAMKWRGLMLDESRHFFGKETVKELLDWMAFYKLDRFHWHLTDAPGWRLRIRRYPKLHLIGGIGNYSDSLAPAAYYTQEDINEIVQYARERFIEIIPEIDIPGHATAANRAYPEYSGGGSERLPDFTFNPGKEGTYAYLTNILKEVDVLFPAKMIHLGGDEVSFGSGHWTSDQDIRRLMAKEHLKDVRSVETYFMRRMADSVINMHARVLGWDEMAAADIPDSSAIIFWWRHDKPGSLKLALDKGYQVVLCPRIPLYFDFVQDSSDLSGRRWSGRFSSSEQLYYFSTRQYPGIIKTDNRDQVLGIQANIWTEKISSVQRLQYMLFPRIAALSVAAWTAPGSREHYPAFKDRVALHEALYKKEGLKYYDLAHPGRSPEIIDAIP